MAKYVPFATYLRGLPSSTHEITLAFAEIETIISQPLPDSAKRERTWWANARDYHPSSYWLASGWRVAKVSFARGEVVFARHSSARSPEPTRKPSVRGTVRSPARTARSNGYGDFLDFLRGLPASQEQVALSFCEVAQIVGHDLPPSALRERTWWSNSYAHPEFAPWVRADWRVDSIYMTAQVVVFRRRGELPLKHIPRYVKYLLEGSDQIAQPDAETVARWLRFCRNVGWYFEGTVLYEKGGFDLNSLSETELVAVEEDYGVCKRELTRYKRQGYAGSAG